MAGPEDDGKPDRRGPTKDEWQLLFVTAAAFVIIVGGGIAFMGLFAYAWVEAHARGDAQMRLMDRPNQSAAPQ